MEKTSRSPRKFHQVMTTNAPTIRKQATSNKTAKSNKTTKSNKTAKTKKTAKADKAASFSRSPKANVINQVVSGLGNRPAADWSFFRMLLCVSRGTKNHTKSNSAEQH